MDAVSSLATPSSLWTLAATICSPLALPRTPICGVLLLCRCCHRPEVPDTGSTLAVTLLPLRWLPLQYALRIRDYNRDSGAFWRFWLLQAATLYLAALMI